MHFLPWRAAWQDLQHYLASYLQGAHLAASALQLLYMSVQPEGAFLKALAAFFAAALLAAAALFAALLAAAASFLAFLAAAFLRRAAAACLRASLNLIAWRWWKWAKRLALAIALFLLATFSLSRASILSMSLTVQAIPFSTLALAASHAGDYLATTVSKLASVATDLVALAEV